MDLQNLDWLQAAIDNGDPAEMMADFLEEQGASISDVLHLFAGFPPFWVQGIPREAVVCWLEAHRDERTKIVAAITVPVPPDPPWHRWDSLEGDKRWVGYRPEAFGHGKPHTLTPEACPVCEEEQRPIVPTISLSCLAHRFVRDNRKLFLARCEQCNTILWALADESPEIMAMKRQVLNLFGDVMVPERVECKGCYSCKGLYGRIRDKGCGGTGAIWTDKEIPASRLIPPDRSV